MPRLSLWPPCVAVAIPAMAAPTVRPIHVSRGRKDAGPGVHFVSSGLLQLTEGVMLQSVENAAARLVSGARRYDHTTPVLQELHWFDVGWISRGHPGLPVTVRHVSSLSGRLLPVGLPRRS